MSREQPPDIDAYIAGCPADVRPTLEAIRAVIRRAAPAAVEAIRYGIPTFVLHENLVHFAAFARHIGFYPGPSGIAKFRRELAPYKSAKGSVQLPLTGRIPLAVIGRIVAFRVAEVEARAAAKRKR